MNSQITWTEEIPQKLMIELGHQLENSTNEMRHQQFEGRNDVHNDKTDIIDQLMKIMIRKDGKIKNMSLELTGLEKQLESAVVGKLDVLARLDAIEGKECTLWLKEKQMDLDRERLNIHIENLTDDSNKKAIELMAVRQELASASAQFEIDLSEKSEKLKAANWNVCNLTQTNVLLRIQNQEYVCKLNEQLNESDKIIKDYENDLKSKIDLAELHKENCDYHQAHIDELTASVIEMQHLLYETVDECGLFEIKMKESELDYQNELVANYEMITNLKQELEDANCLLKAYHNNDRKNLDDEVEDELVNILPYSSNHRLRMGMTFTEIYSQYCAVVSALQTKEQECQILEVEVKNLVEYVNEKAIQFNQQQKEGRNHQVTDDELVEKRKNFLVEKYVAREEMEANRIRFTLLNTENKELKSAMKFYVTEYLKNIQSMRANEVANKNLDVVEGTSNQRANAVELEQQNQQLLVLVYELIDIILKMEDVDTTNENYEFEEGGDDKENLVANTSLCSSTTNVCVKSVEVTDDELMLEGNRNDSSGVNSPKENLLKIDELTPDNNKLRNELWEKNRLLAESNLAFLQKSDLNQKIQTLSEQNQTYLSTIAQYKIANKFLKDENVNTTMKLSTADGRFKLLQNEYRSMITIKISLETEVEKLRLQLAQAKVSDMKGASADSAWKPDAEITAQIVTNTTKLPETAFENHEASRTESEIPSASMEEIESFHSLLDLMKPSQPIPSLQPNCHSSTLVSVSSNDSMKLKSTERAFVYSSEDSNEDEIIDIGEDTNDLDLPNIELQFIKDAFHRYEVAAYFFIFIFFNCYIL